MDFSQSIEYGLGAVIAPDMRRAVFIHLQEWTYKEELQQIKCNGQLNAYLQSEADL